MEIDYHTASEEWLLKSLVKREDNEFNGIQLKEKPINCPHGKQSGFLKNLLLTGNEIDLKKVLCLHLFAITVPPKPCKRSEDNNKIVEFTTYSFALPNFFLHNFAEEKFYCKCWYKENKEKIGKLRPCKIHLAVNVAVVEIIETALEVLNSSNKFAFEKLITLSHDLSAIMSCLSDKQYVDYIADLRHYGIFNNVQRLRTETCTIIKATPKLMEISHIKKNMVFSLKLTDFIQSPNDWFLISTSNKTVFNSPEPQLEENNSINIENKKGQSKGVEIKSNIKKFSKTVPGFNSTTIKRWPFTNKEINIKKELKQIERINDIFLSKNDINSTDKVEIKNMNTVPDSSSFEKKNPSNEETIQLERHKTIKLDSKSKMSASSSKYKNASHNKRDASLAKVLFEHKYAQSREKSWIKHFSKQREKELNRKDTSDVSKFLNKDINKPISIDRIDLKNGLLKIEYHSKLQKLISSVDGTLFEN